MVEPEDFLKFGLIPEFVGRLPVVTTLEALDEEALKRILCEPKNALVKQYKELFAYDGVEIIFEDSALSAAAQKAKERKTGARGLRAILEETLSDIMFEIPSDPDAQKVIVTGENVRDKNIKPQIVKKSAIEAS